MTSKILKLLNRNNFLISKDVYMQNKKIVGINTNFSSTCLNKFPFFSEITFDETISLYDYDAIIINPKICFSTSNVQRKKIENGLCLSSEAVFKYKTVFDSIRTQLIDLLQQGKNIYVIMNLPDKYYYINFDERYDFNILSFLPFEVDYEVLEGKYFNIQKLEPYTSFFSSFQQFISYKNLIKGDAIRKLVTMKNSEKMIAGIRELYNGKIIFIPDFSRSPTAMLIFANESIKHETDNREELFIDAIFKLEEKMSSNIEETLPVWTESFSILNEDDLKTNILDIEYKLEKLKEELENKETELRKIQEYKYLLTSSGKNLEAIVKKVLNEIGFTLFETEENRTDVIAKYKDRDVVFEIKGVKHSAAEKNAAQLEKWVSEFISMNNKIPKAVLIVNGYYELPITERNEPIFPNQMLNFSKGREHCLLSTYQLLKLFIEIKQHPEKSEHLINELLNTVGVYENYK